MNTDRFELPPTLAVWLEAARAPSELLGRDGARELVEVAIDSLLYDPTERRTMADREMGVARVIAAGRERETRVWFCELDIDSARRMAVLSCWTHDVLTVPDLARRLIAEHAMSGEMSRQLTAWRREAVKLAEAATILESLLQSTADRPHP